MKKDWFQMEYKGLSDKIDQGAIVKIKGDNKKYVVLGFGLGPLSHFSESMTYGVYYAPVDNVQAVYFKKDKYKNFKKVGFITKEKVNIYLVKLKLSRKDFPDIVEKKDLVKDKEDITYKYSLHILEPSIIFAIIATGGGILYTPFIVLLVLHVKVYITLIVSILLLCLYLILLVKMMGDWEYVPKNS